MAGFGELFERIMEHEQAAVTELHRIADEIALLPAAQSAKGAFSRRGVFCAQKLFTAVAAPGETPNVEAAVEIVKGVVGEDVEAMDEKSVRRVAEVCLSRREDIRRAAGGELAARLGGNYLADFDWRAHLTVASDSCSRMDKGCVTVGLCISSPDGKTENVVFEADQGELADIIAQLEKASAAITDLTA